VASDVTEDSKSVAAIYRRLSGS